ncbi:MAG: methyltransferase domain-containing protein [Candidatus Helarchaeota archaeon]
MGLKTFSNFHQDVINAIYKLYKNKTFNILRSLKRPTPIYVIRINTLKVKTKDVLNELKKEGLNFKLFEYKGVEIEEAIYYKIDKKKNKIKLQDKIIYVDKFSGESIAQGANLYRPGVKNFNKFNVDDELTVVSEINNLKIPVANVRAVVSSKDLTNMNKGLIAKNIRPLYNGISIHDLEIFKKGYIYDQSLPAIITSKVLNPECNDFIIDLCAGPGGKTTHISQLMNNRGHILAIDRSNKKLERIKQNLKRLGVKNVELLKKDSTKLEGYEADKILIDPPCSALGTRPKLADFTTQKDIENFAKYQKQFIKSALKNIKSRGIIVYSTCTLSLEENEMNIDYMIKKFNCKLINQPIFIGSHGFSSFVNYKMTLTQRFSPSKHSCPGFFIAKLLVP